MKHLCTVLLVILASGCTSAAALKASESRKIKPRGNERDDPW